MRKFALEAEGVTKRLLALPNNKEGVNKALAAVLAALTALEKASV